MEASQGSGEGNNRGRGRNKRFWTYDEDAILIKCLHELAFNPKWRSESGFKNGYMNKLEEMIKRLLPNSGLKADPHIESMIKHWSEKYSALAEILSTSGFGWDAEKKMLQAEKTVFDEWAKTHKKANGLFGVPFVHYDTLAEIYAKDKATGEASESFVGAVEDMDQEIANHALNIDIDEDDDVDSTQSTTHYGNHSIKIVVDNHRTPKRAKVKDSKEKGKNKMDLKSLGKKIGTDELVASLHNVFDQFGRIFENININLGTMACAWSKAEEREQKLDDKVNQVLEEVMKLEGISPSEALEAATVLMAEEHKLRIFYQTPLNMKKQYIIDLLRKK